MNKYLLLLEGDSESRDLLKRILYEKAEGKVDRLRKIVDDLFDSQVKIQAHILHLRKTNDWLSIYSCDNIFSYKAIFFDIKDNNLIL